MDNTLTAAEIKRRGMAAIEEQLCRGPVHLVKGNRRMAVVVSADEYQRLTAGKSPSLQGMTAVQWLLAQSVSGTRSKADIDEALAEERAW